MELLKSKWATCLPKEGKIKLCRVLYVRLSAVSMFSTSRLHQFGFLLSFMTDYSNGPKNAAFITYLQKFVGIVVGKTILEWFWKSIRIRNKGAKF